MIDQQTINPELFAKIMEIILQPDAVVVVHYNDIKYTEYFPEEDIGYQYSPEGINKFQFADICKSIALKNKVSLRTCKLFSGDAICWFNAPVKPWEEVQVRAAEEWMTSMLAIEWLDQNGYIKHWDF